MTKALKIRFRRKLPGHLQKRLRELRAAMPQAFSAALYQEGFALDALANSNDYIPVDTGRMRATHYVAPPIRTGRFLRVEVGYGVEYAIYVHERRELAHVTGRAGWLLAALQARAPGFYGRLAARTRQNFEKGVGVDSLHATAPDEPHDPGPRASRRKLKADWSKAKRQRTKRALMAEARRIAAAQKGKS